MKIFSPAVFACTALLTLSPINAAFALDGEDFAKKLADVISNNGMIVDMGDVSTNGDTITITGVTIAPPGEDKVEMKKPIVFSGVTETKDGGYTADEAKVSAFIIEAEDIEVSVGDIIVEDIIIPADGIANPMASITLYRHILTGAVTVKSKDKEIFSIESIEALNTLDAASNILTGTSAIEGIHLDLAGLEDSGIEELAVAQALGLDVINARLVTESVWDINTGALAIEQGLIDIENVGKLNFTGEVLGYDEAMLKELYVLQRETTIDPDAEPEEILADSQKLLALIGEKLSLSKVSIRFDDASITGKILGMIAAQSGTTPDVMASGLAATLPMMAAQFGMPEGLATMLSEAVGTFLQDPKNIEISINPTEPVPLKETMVVMVDPSSLESLFNLSIKANQ